MKCISSCPVCRNVTLALGALALLGAAAYVVLVVARPVFADVVKEPTAEPAKAGPLDFTVKDIDGKDQPLSAYKGKVVLIVNVASKCGKTPQYKPLQAMYEKYKDQGFETIGFPANNFGKQEPGSNEEIKSFCTERYKVTFPMMSKISVKGDDKAPLYQYLTDKKTAGDFSGEIGWNFTKFLVDRNGNLIARFATGTEPDDPKVIETIEKALKAKAPEKK